MAEEEDPFASFITNSTYSSSQENLFHTSLHARQTDPILPEPLPSSSDAFAGGGILICSAPQTPDDDEDFKTPPEDPRRSSSEEPPPPEISPHAVELDDGGNPRVGEGKMVEVLSNGEVRVGEVFEVELESFRVGEKRSLIQEPLPSPSPSKRIRVSAKLVTTPNLGTSVETEVCNAEDDTEVIEDSNDEGESFGNDVRVSNEEQEQVMENGNDDGFSRKGRRELPSWACQKEDIREEESRVDREKGVGDELKLVLEVMALLSREAGPSRGTGDLLETVKARGVTFPEPKWWHDDE